MATTTQPTVSVDDYLKTTYHPDCDYIDGELQERNLGDPEHAEVQGALVEWFRGHGKEWNIRALPEARIQISPTRFRVADVGLYSRRYPINELKQQPPLAVIEIVSPEDRISRYAQRIGDYRIQHIWVVNPQTRRGFDCFTGSWIETQSFKIENSPIAVDLSVIFADLD
ncbi:MAG TPA: Uma2 family endonuclease [Terriglobales bacterium]|nr:Uma2 family endonuclease [Terriglobales bacterium]